MPSVRACGKIRSVDDAVARYRSASEANDIDALMASLAPDVELLSPIGRSFVFRGERDLRVLLGVVYGTIKGLRWHEEVGDGPLRVVLGDCTIGPLKLGDAMVCELDENGRIRRVTPHLRPWLALSCFALAIGPRMARHPGIILRAMRRR
jgi:hypothetical protein